MNIKYNFEYILLTFIILIGFFVRLYKIDNPVADWHSWRQADTASVTRIYIERGVDVLRPRYHDISSIQTGIFNPEGYRMVEFPIYNVIVANLIKFFPVFTLEVWSRVTIIIFSLVTCYFLFLLGKKHANSSVGLLAALFYAVLPFNIYFTRVILPDPIGVTFAVAGLYFFSHKKILSALLISLAFLIKPYFIFYLTPLIPEVLKRKNMAYWFLVFTPFLLWRGWVSQFPEGVPFYTWAFNGDRIRLHPSFFRWILWERLSVLILGIIGLIPFIAAFVKGNRNKFVLQFLLGMLLYVVVVATANVRHDYYQILVVPAISLALASGSFWLWKKSKLMLLIVVPLTLWIGWQKIEPFYRVNHPELMEIGKEIDHITPKDSLIVAPYNGDTAFLYQMHRRGWPAIDDSIDNIIDRGADYYVSLDLNSQDTQNFSARFVTVKRTDRYIILDLHKEL